MKCTTRSGVVGTAGGQSIKGRGEGDIYKSKRKGEKIKHSEIEHEIGSIKLTMPIENNII